MRTTDELNKLQKQDIYHLMLFALYTLIGVPEYSSLGELAYVLDEKNLFNFLEYFGGTTVKVPTLEELRIMVNALLLYQYVDVEKMEYEKAVAKIKKKDIATRDITTCYFKLKDVLKTYVFNPRENP